MQAAITAITGGVDRDALEAGHYKQQLFLEDVFQQG